MFHNVSKVVLCDRRNTVASFSEDKLHFSWQAQHFGELHRHFVRVARSVDNLQIAWQAWDIVRVSFCVEGAAFGEDLSCVECHCAWQAQYLAHSTLHTFPLHFTLYAPHYTLYTLHSTLRTLHSTLHTLHCILHFALHTLHFTLSTPHSTLQTPHSTIRTSHSTHYIPHSTLHFLHTPHLALPPLPLSTVYSALVR